jgi:tetratricopeptide (TPR) repeat protein
LADAQRWIPAQKEKSRRSYQRAIDLLAPLLEAAPDEITYNSRMALYSAYTGAREQAVEIMRKAIALAPDTADVQFRAAMTHELLGNREQALAALRLADKQGYPLNLIESEPALLNLRRDPQYFNFLTERDSKK